MAVHPPGDPLPEPKQVSVLGAGGVVVTYRDLSDDDRTRLENHVQERYESRVAVTPYEQLRPGRVAFTAWGVLPALPGAGATCARRVRAAYADEEPDVPGKQ